MSEPGLVIVDKDAGMTSHDVVARIRRLARTKRVGHAGTLDPMATGVLVVGVDRATRLLGHLTLAEKEYEATIRLGAFTVTDDADGEIVPRGPDAAVRASELREDQIHSALAGLTGEIMQVPPQISAIKINGQRAYHLTRSGAAPELKARNVTIRRLDLLALRPASEAVDLDVSVTCSSGTYVRAIARDLGTVLRTGGHLTALRRIRVGRYRIGEARTLDQLAEHFDCIPLARAAASSFPSVVLDREETRLISHGARIPVRALAGVRSPDQDAWRTGGQQDGAGLAADAGLTGDAGPGAGAGSSSAGKLELAGAFAASAWFAAPTIGADPRTGPVAAFDSDGALVALLDVSGRDVRPIAVFTS